MMGFLSGILVLFLIIWIVQISKETWDETGDDISYVKYDKD